MNSDIREALRSLRAAPGFTAVVILTLALAVGVNATLFSVLYGVLLRPLDYADPDRLVALFESNEQLGQAESEVALATWADWRAGTTAFSELGAWRYRGFTLSGDTDPERIASVEATPSVFDVLGVPASLGRTFRRDEERRGNERLAIISHGAWVRRFGRGADVIGRSLRLDDQSYEIVGVMPETFQFPAGDKDVEVWTPITFDLTAMASRPHRMYGVVGRLTPGQTLEQARADMARVSDRIARDNPATNTNWGARLVPAHEQVVGNVRGTLWILFGAVVLVLAIACANVANLVLARSTRTAPDFAIRAAFGAGRWVLVRRSLVETAILALSGAVAGFGLAWVGIRALRGLVPANVPRAESIGLDPAVLGFTAAVAGVAGVLFGLVPALRAMRPNVLDVLQASGRGGASSRRGRRLSDLMVVTEVALALVLVIGAGLLVRSFIRLTAVDPGFRTSRVVATDIVLPETRYPRSPPKQRFFLDLLDQVRAMPGIESAGAVSVLPMSPLGNDFALDFTIAGLEARSPSERPRAAYRGVLPGFFETMGIPAKQGRVIDQFDGRETGPRVAVVNETLARRYFDGVDPINQRIRVPMAGDLQIVGVVGDTRQGGLGDVASPQVYVPYFQLALSEMQIVVLTDLSAADVTTRMRAAIARLDPQLPIVKVSAIEDLISASVAQPRFNMALLVGLALSAALLAAVGVYGVVTYSVTRRTGEIGVRMALGADPGSTFQHVVMGAARVVVTGVVIGCVAAAALGQWLQSLLFGVSPLDVATYVAAGLTLVLLGVAAASVPALRASRIDPVRALREK
jgi:putative ABC transport system permease protein